MEHVSIVTMFVVVLLVLINVESVTVMDGVLETVIAPENRPTAWVSAEVMLNLMSVWSVTDQVFLSVHVTARVMSLIVSINVEVLLNMTNVMSVTEQVLPLENAIVLTKNSIAPMNAVERLA